MPSNLKIYILWHCNTQILFGCRASEAFHVYRYLLSVLMAKVWVSLTSCNQGVTFTCWVRLLCVSPIHISNFKPICYWLDGCRCGFPLFSYTPILSLWLKWGWEFEGVLHLRPHLQGQEPLLTTQTTLHFPTGSQTQTATYQQT